MDGLAVMCLLLTFMAVVASPGLVREQCSDSLTMLVNKKPGIPISIPL